MYEITVLIHFFASTKEQGITALFVPIRIPVPSNDGQNTVYGGLHSVGIVKTQILKRLVIGTVCVDIAGQVILPVQ